MVKRESNWSVIFFTIFTMMISYQASNERLQSGKFDTIGNSIKLEGMKICSHSLDLNS